MSVRPVRSAEPCSTICIAVGRGFRTDPRRHAGLAHVAEHLWFAEPLTAPTVALGATNEDTVVLCHTCPADETVAVLQAVITRLAVWRTVSSTERAHQVDAACRLIALEARGVRESAAPVPLRRSIARALRGDPGFDVNDVALRGLAADGSPDPDGWERAIAHFADDIPLAVSVVGPPTVTCADIEELWAGTGLVREAPRATSPEVGSLRGTWTHEGRHSGAAWVLPATAAIEATSCVVTELLADAALSGDDARISGRVISASGPGPLRNGLLWAVAAMPVATPGPFEVAGRLVELLDNSEPATVARAVERIGGQRDDIAALAVADATDLVLRRHGSADDVSAECTRDAVSDAIGRVDAAAVRAFAELLAGLSHAMFVPTAGVT